MENFKIINIGKALFWLSFILGNICLFGYFLTKDHLFAIGGYLLLISGTIVNSIAFLVFIFYGFTYPEQSKESFRAAFILLINIPIAILYASIGITYL